MTSCPICHSVDHKIVYPNLPGFAGLSVVQCKACKQVYTFSNIPIEREELYNDEVYKVVEIRKSIFDRILTWEYSGVINAIKKFRPSGSLLDFGTGKGHFANLAKKAGFRVKAVETSVERAGYARDVYGIEVNTTYYKSGMIFTNRFDIITLFHVIEHLPEPKAILKELINGNLQKGGLLVIEVPNFNSLQSTIAGSRWMHLDPERHVSHFTAGQLEKMATDLDLQLYKTNYFSFHLGVLGMTDSILKKIGYRKNIIFELKNRKPPLLIVLIIILLPFTLMTEGMAAIFKKGGIIRKYFLVPNKQK